MPREVLKELKNSVDDDPSKITVADLEHAIEAGDFYGAQDLQALAEDLLNSESGLRDSFFDAFNERHGNMADETERYSSRALDFAKVISYAINTSGGITELNEHEQKVYLAYQRYQESSLFIMSKQAEFLTLFKDGAFDELLQQAGLNAQNHEAFIAAMNTFSSVREVGSINGYTKNETIYAYFKSWTPTQLVAVVLHLKYKGYIQGDITEITDEQAQSAIMSYKDYKAAEHKRGGRVLTPYASDIVGYVNDYVNGEKAFSNEQEKLAFWYAVSNSPPIVQLRELKDRQSVEDFVNKYEHRDADIALIQFYLNRFAGSIGYEAGVNDKLNGRIADSEKLESLVFEFVKVRNLNGQIETLNSIEAYRQFSNTKLALEWVATIYQSMLKNEKFRKLRTHKDEEYEQQAKNIGDFINILPHVQSPEQLAMLVEGILVPVEEAYSYVHDLYGPSVNPDDMWRNKFVSLIEGSKTTMLLSLSTLGTEKSQFQTMDDVHNYVMDFVVDLREVDESNEAFLRKYSTTAGVNSYIDTYLDGSFRTDKSGLEDYEVREAEGLENGIQTIDKVMNDDKKMMQLFGALGREEESQIAYYNKDGFPVYRTVDVFQPEKIASLLEERGIECPDDDYTALANEIGKGLKKLHEQKEALIKKHQEQILKQHDIDPNNPPEDPEKRELWEKQIDAAEQQAYGMFWLQNRLFITQAFQSVAINAVLTKYQSTVVRLGEEGSWSGRMLMVKSDIIGVGRDRSDETWNKVATYTEMFVTELITSMVGFGASAVIAKVLVRALKAGMTALRVTLPTMRINALAKVLENQPFAKTLLKSLATGVQKAAGEGTVFLFLKPALSSLASTEVNGRNDILSHVGNHVGKTENIVANYAMFGFLKSMQSYLGAVQGGVNLNSVVDPILKNRVSRILFEEFGVNLGDVVADKFFGDNNFTNKDLIQNAALGLGFEFMTFGFGRFGRGVNLETGKMENTPPHMEGGGPGRIDPQRTDNHYDTRAQKRESDDSNRQNIEEQRRAPHELEGDGRDRGIQDKYNISREHNQAYNDRMDDIDNHIHDPNYLRENAALSDRDIAKVQANYPIVMGGVRRLFDLLPTRDYGLVTISGLAHFFHTGNLRSLTGKPDGDFAMHIGEFSGTFNKLMKALDSGEIKDLKVASVDKTQVFDITPPLSPAQRNTIESLIFDGKGKVEFDYVHPNSNNPDATMEMEIFFNYANDGLTQVGGRVKPGENTNSFMSGEGFTDIRTETAGHTADSYVVNTIHEARANQTELTPKSGKVGKRFLKIFELKPNLKVSGIIDYFTNTRDLYTNFLKDGPESKPESSDGYLYDAVATDKLEQVINDEVGGLQSRVDFFQTKAQNQADPNYSLDTKVNARLRRAIESQTNRGERLYKAMQTMKQLQQKIADGTSLSERETKRLQTIYSEMIQAKGLINKWRNLSYQSNDVAHFGVFYNAQDLDSFYIKPMEHLFGDIQGGLGQDRLELESVTAGS